MQRIFKYPLQITDVQSIAIPRAAKFLHVGDNPEGMLCLWALVDDSNPLVNTEICIVGTGNYFPDAAQWPNYIGTAVMRPLVWHVFSRTPFAE